MAKGKEGAAVEKESITAKETEEEIARLKMLARKTHDVKLRQRYDIIRLFLCKRAKPDIAATMDISLTQVYLILNLYKEEGIEGLGFKRPTGRQRKLTDEQERELRGVITEKLPKEVGLEPYCNWTAPLACKYVKEHYGVTFSERGRVHDPRLPGNSKIMVCQGTAKNYPNLNIIEQLWGWLKSTVINNGGPAKFRVNDKQ